MASHFTSVDAAPRIAQLDATLRQLVYGNDAVMAALPFFYAANAGVMRRDPTTPCIWVVSGELIALESGAVWLGATHHARDNVTQRARRVELMMERTGVNIYRIPGYVARLSGFFDAADMAAETAEPMDHDRETIIVREYMYNVRARATMQITEKMIAIKPVFFAEQ